MELLIKTICYLFTICLILTSCSGTKHLPKGEKLYMGAEIKLESADHISHSKKKFIKTSAKDALSPQPNKKFIGLRPKLWMYMKAGQNPQSKLNKWFKKKGEAPVFISSTKPTVIAAIIDARLFNIGIFNSFTEYKIIEKKHTANIIYTSHVYVPYTINEIIYSCFRHFLSFKNTTSYISVI